MVLGCGAASSLGVHVCVRARVCVFCVHWMQMWSWSCVVQSGCTRRATAEHSEEIIHQSKRGTAEPLSVEEQNRYARVWTCHHKCSETFIYLQYITKVSPVESSDTCILTSYHCGEDMLRPYVLLASKCCQLLESRSLIKQFTNCLYSNNPK